MSLVETRTSSHYYRELITVSNSSVTIRKRYLLILKSYRPIEPLRVYYANS
ncbi:hypothetical protein CsSME_00015072 [Camellia sinensis var. sinensis]